jgi:small subunit ribosomal protein S9
LNNQLFYISMTPTPAKTERYLEAVGRRKTAIARVRLYPAAKTTYTLNDRTLDSYFPTTFLRHVATEAFATAKVTETFKVSVKLSGGGIEGQAEAVRLGIARALLVLNPSLRAVLKKAGFLMRDPRAKERRKFGLKKARKAPQWSKR